jgi:hypothetical protein
MAQSGADRKPSIGFQARFFLEGSERRMWLKGNGLELEKAGKTGKTQKKAQNNFPDTADFLQNAPTFSAKNSP